VIAGAADRLQAGRIGHICQFDQGGAALFDVLVTAAKMTRGGKGLQKLGGMVIQRHNTSYGTPGSGVGLNIGARRRFKVPLKAVL